jgi:hypothetical protein
VRPGGDQDDLALRGGVTPSRNVNEVCSLSSLDSPCWRAFPKQGRQDSNLQPPVLETGSNLRNPVDADGEIGDIGRVTELLRLVW